MPKRTDLKRIMVVGSGPIVIGQACEFDYSGPQAIKALKREGVELIGATAESLRIAEDRKLFRDAMIEIGLEVPTSELVSSAEAALAFAEKTGYPVILRPSFTLGGSGGGIAYNDEECEAIA